MGLVLAAAARRGPKQQGALEGPGPPPPFTRPSVLCNRCKGLSVGLPGLSVQLFCQLSVSFPGTCAAGAKACLCAFQACPCSCFASCLSTFQATAQQVQGPVSGPSRLVRTAVLHVVCERFQASAQQVQGPVCGLSKGLRARVLQIVRQLSRQVRSRCQGLSAGLPGLYLEGFCKLALHVCSSFSLGFQGLLIKIVCKLSVRLLYKGLSRGSLTLAMQLFWKRPKNVRQRAKHLHGEALTAH